MKKLLGPDEVYQLWVSHPTSAIPKGEFCAHCCRYNARHSTSQCIIWRVLAEQTQVLLIKRAHNPARGYWALPGGYLEWDETLEVSAIRELEEEVGLTGSPDDLLLSGVYSDPSRDEDGRQNVAVLYSVKFDQLNSVAKSTTDESKFSEVSEQQWFSLNLLPDKIAFDHRQMLEQFSSRVASLP